MDADSPPGPALRPRASGLARALYDSFLVGRSRRCDMRLDDRAVSAEHAQLSWHGRSWTVQDLGSRNGTFVNGRRLEPGARELLIEGAVLSFGSTEHTFDLVDAGAPGVVAVANNGSLVRAQGGWIELSDDPPVSVQWVGDAGRWAVERAEGLTPVDHLEEVVVGEVAWRLHLPGLGDTTLQHTAHELVAPLLEEVTLHFSVSRDEETVAAWVDHEGTTYDLGSPAHNYVMLTLARLRLQDAESSDIPPAEHGWVAVPDLLRMLRVSENKLNVDIHRCRKRMAATPVDGASRLVQRRRSSRQVRLGTGQVRIQTADS